MLGVKSVPLIALVSLCTQQADNTCLERQWCIHVLERGVGKGVSRPPWGAEAQWAVQSMGKRIFFKLKNVNYLAKYKQFHESM